MGRRNVAAASKGRGLRPFYLILGALAVVGLAALGYAVFAAGAGGAALEPIPVEGADDPRTLVARAEGVSLGDPSAPAKLLVFSDYQCPYCGQFAAQIAPLLKAEFVDSGMLELVYYDFPLAGVHRHSFLASRAARCAGEQGKFWEYHDVLFGEQSRWSASSRAPLDELEAYAERIGLDREQFGACLRSDRFADVVSANKLLGEQLGVTGTPTLILNGRRVTSWSNYAELKKLIEREAGA
ncbi:MAG TPA: DsbA family protein [Longimicrobiales bacterium]